MNNLISPEDLTILRAFENKIQEDETIGRFELNDAVNEALSSGRLDREKFPERNAALMRAEEISNAAMFHIGQNSQKKV